MPHCKFRLSDSFYLGGSIWDIPSHNPAEEVVIELLGKAYPNPITERWDGAVGLRPATAQEMADASDAENDATAARELDQAVQKALRDVLLNIEVRLNIVLGVPADDSRIPVAVRQSGIAAATTPAEYTAALKDIVKAANPKP